MVSLIWLNIAVTLSGSISVIVFAKDIELVKIHVLFNVLAFDALVIIIGKTWVPVVCPSGPAMIRSFRIVLTMIPPDTSRPMIIRVASCR